MSTYPVEGGCDCGKTRYRVISSPLVVHCCHCRWCQRETGASFALNAMIESDRVESVGEVPEIIDTPSNSGKGQQIARCRHCKIALWSHYGGNGPLTRFVRVGTLDNPDLLAPDVHIFTESKQPWLTLGDNTPVYSQYYVREEVWRSDVLERWNALLPAIKAYKQQ